MVARVDRLRLGGSPSARRIGVVVGGAARSTDLGVEAFSTEERRLQAPMPLATTPPAGPEKGQPRSSVGSGSSAAGSDEADRRRRMPTTPAQLVRVEPEANFDVHRELRS